VVLFADIAEFTRLSEDLNPEQVTRLANCCLDRMGQIVARHGGHVDKYTGDGLVGLFGAPLSHEDDPSRALRAAMAMQEEISQLDLGLPVPQLALHIGAACGPVVAARMGSRKRKEYTVIGTAVNLASRLESLSDAGQILVSEHLWRLTQHRFAFELVPVEDEVGLEVDQVHELVGDCSERVLPLPHAPLVGRAEELATLMRTFSDLQAGRGGVVSIQGPAGIGKTRLVAELRRRAGDAAAQVLWLQGAPPTHGTGADYEVLRRVVRDALRQEEVPGELVSLLEDAPRLASTHHPVYPFLSRLSARQPVVVVLEDFHWADKASLKLLEPLAALTRDHALLLIVVSRISSGRGDRGISSRLEAGAGGRCAEIGLRPLSDAEMRTLLDSLLEGDQLPAPVDQLIRFRSGGNPLFVEAQLSAALDRRASSGETPRSAGDRDVVVPETIRRLVQPRLDRIDDEAKRVLQVAACIGYRVPYELVSAVVPEVTGVRGELRSHLQRLEAAALLRRRGDGPSDDYIFWPPLVRDTVYAGLLKDARRRFCAAVELAVRG
jgi:hypothetical protein